MTNYDDSNKRELNTKGLMKAAIFGIIFLTYNMVLFAICGFADHGAMFWLSYLFVIIAFATFAISAAMLKVRSSWMNARDFLFGYPILVHCRNYFIAEIILSIVFVIWDYASYQDGPWAVAFTVQFLLLAFSLVMIISCFLAKSTIEDVQSGIKESTTFMKMLRADAEMVVEKATDPDIKKAYAHLAEQIRYSDTRSAPELQYLERELSALVNEAGVYASINDKDNAMKNYDKALILLAERNKKCQLLKK